ncbi:MAG: hypothetical protein AB2A00_08580 [Myxococcota bacterium]
MNRYVVGWIAAVGIMTGCATSQGRIPSPPTDTDLSHDGTPAAMESRVAAYEVRDEGVIRIGEATRPRAEALDTRMNPEVRAYLSSNPDAARALPPTTLGLVQVGSLVMSVVFAAGALLTLIATNAALVGLNAWGLGAGVAMGQGQALWTSSVVVMAAGLVVVGAWMLAGFLAFAAGVQLGLLRDKAEKAAVRIFNAQLRRRVTEAGPARREESAAEH